MRVDEYRTFNVRCLEDPSRSYLYIVRSCVEVINMAAYYENLKAQRPTEIYVWERMKKNGQGTFDD